MKNLPVFVSIWFLMISAGCATAPGTTTPTAGAELFPADVTAEQVLEWGYSQRISADLDGNGSSELVRIFADAAVDQRGRPMWEDGHRWAVLVSESGNDTLAWAAFVPNGVVDLGIAEPSNDGVRELVVSQRTPYQLAVITIAYDGPGEVRSTSANIHAIENWLPRSP